MIKALATVLGLAVLLGVATLAAPQQGGGEAGAATAAQIDPVRQPVACPGALEIPVGAISSGDEDLDSVSEDVAFAVTPAGQPAGAGVAVDDSQAVGLERVGSGDIAGLAGASCTAPARDQWLVGGATTLGASARLVLTNPTDSAVRAHVSIHGPVGVHDEQPSVLVGAHSQETLLIESVAPELPGLAIHVTAEGVGIAAALQDSRLDGFTPAGTDWVSPSTAATSLAVPVAGPSSDGAQAVLSLIAPEGAQATLTLETAEGAQPWLGEEALTLEAGVVTDLLVPAVDLAAVRIESTSPVAGAVRTLVAREAPIDAAQSAYDHAWTAAQPLADQGTRALVVPDGDVTLVAQADAAASLVLDASGGPVELAVADASVASLELDVAPGTVLSSTSPLAWALLVQDAASGFVTTIEPVGTDLAPTELEVRVGDAAPLE